MPSPNRDQSLSRESLPVGDHSGRRSGRVVYAAADAAALLQPHLAALSHPKDAGFEQIKKNASRTVYRHVIDGQAVYVKHFHSRSFFHRLGWSLGRVDARREMTFARLLAAGGVSTPEVLAGCWRGGEHWLVTAAVEPAVAADVWHAERAGQGPAGRAAVREVTVALAELVGRMHAAGVVHGDLHCGNVLIRTDRRDVDLVLTDLHRARKRRHVSRRTRTANLAQLLHDRWDFTTRTDRLRFLKHYLRVSNAEGTLRGWQRMVEHLAARHRRRQYAQRDRRCRRTDQYFARVRLGGRWRGHVVLASKRRLGGSKAAEQVFTVDEWRQVLADPAVLLSPGDGQVVKESRSSLVVRRTIRLGDRDLDVFVKQHRRKAFWKALVDCVRPSRAIRAFRLGHALLTRRIPVALPLAAIERRVGPFLTDNIIVSEAVPWPRLDEFLRTHLGVRPNVRNMLSAHQLHQLTQEVLWQMGRLLQKLHDNNYAHRDLKASNMLVRWEDGQSGELVLVDLDGLRPVRRISMRQRFQGLMRLNVSLLQCPAANHPCQLRMLLGYLRRPGSGRINFKAYWRVLEVWSARKLNQQIRSRRGLQLVRRQAAQRATA